MPPNETFVMKSISGKSIFINSLLLLLSVIFSLLLLEQGFRCWLFGWKAFDIEALRNNVPINNAGFMVQSPFDDIYWALKPDLDISFKLARLTTNSHGMADHEYPLEKPANSYRIAVLGDSYSMSSGVDTDKSFHALLENWMNEQGNHPYEIINFAVGGFGLERYNATLEHLVPEWKPDAILLGYCGFNDHQALPPKTNSSVPAFNPRRINGFWMSYVNEYIRMKQNEKTAMQDTSGAVLGEEHLTFIDHQLGNMRTLADRIKPDMPIVLAYLDNRAHSEQDLQNIEAIAKKHNIRFVDTSRQFKETNIDDYSIHMLDSHPDSRAQTMFAKTLFYAIQQKQLFGFSKMASPQVTPQ
jgi:hypothetical protein